MRSADARSRGNDRPAGVAVVFQVRENKIEPRPAKRTRNLLAKQDCRATDAEQTGNLRPKMAGVVEARPLARARKRLTRTGAGPNRSISGPIGESEGVVPAANAGEQMNARGFAE